MICKECGRDVPHLRYDPITEEPIGCIGCMPEEAPSGIEDDRHDLAVRCNKAFKQFPSLQLGFYGLLNASLNGDAATKTNEQHVSLEDIDKLKSLTRLQIPPSDCIETRKEGE